MDSVETPQLNLGENVDSAPIADAVPHTPALAVPSSSIPRSLSFLDLYSCWQPMGVRVVVNLPYVANDSNALFVIRVNPFIPHLGDTIGDNIYAWANLFPVRHDLASTAEVITEGNLASNAVTISQYGMPPNFSILSKCFRRWKGSIMYRIRTTSNFAVQGQIIAGMVRGLPILYGTRDPCRTEWPIVRPDVTLAEIMLNSHCISDLSMYRHLEILCPFVYQVDWYDQATRLLYGSKAFGDANTATADFCSPVGDNYLFVCARGVLAADGTSNQVAFELDYRPGPDFEFSEPMIPPPGWWKSKLDYLRAVDNTRFFANPIMPNTAFTTDGIRAFLTPAVTTTQATNSVQTRSVTAQALSQRAQTQSTSSTTTTTTPLPVGANSDIVHPADCYAEGVKAYWAAVKLGKSVDDSQAAMAKAQNDCNENKKRVARDLSQYYSDHAKDILSNK